MSLLERQARAIRAEIAENHAAAETPPKMAQRRAALFLRSRYPDIAPAWQEAFQQEVEETSVPPHEDTADTPDAPQPQPLAFFFPPRPNTTGKYAPSLKRRAAIRKAEIAELEEAEATFKPSAASTRFFRSTPTRDLTPPTETVAVTSEKKKRLRLSPKKWGLIGAAALVCAGYIGVAATHSDVVPQGTTVAGVDIGSLSPEQAAAKLSSELGDKTSTKFAVTLPDSDEGIPVDPENYDLTLDADETVDSVSGFSLAPTSVVAHLFGGGEHDPVVHYDEVKLAEQLQDIQSHVEGGYVNANITFENLEPTCVPAQDGLGIDREDATDALTVGAFTAKKPIALSLSQMSPPVDDDAAQEAIEKYARPLVAGNIEITYEQITVQATPEALAKAAHFVPVDDELVLQLDGQSLAAPIYERNPEGLTPGTDAVITIVDHKKVEITPSTDGIGIDGERLSADIVDLLDEGGDAKRSVTAYTAPVPAAFSTKDAENMGITEIVSEIDTPFHVDYYRTLNLIRGAELTSGKLIRPGETFVLSEALSPVDASNGFYPAGMIIGGQHKDGMGGGLSQITTNTFNLGYLAGYTDVEHHPHSYYFERYPMGHEATLAIGGFDMKWTNNTPYGAIIDSWVEDGYVHSRLWSTKYWDVEVVTSEQRNIYPSGWVTRTDPGCVATGRGQPGFTVTVSRTVRRGAEEWTETADVSYQPDHGVRCVTPEPKPSDTPSPDSSE
ncbi:MAG: VanW family protein [Actinomycetaceae bacterium]|nr:VanW family protein [Actinomycetaceae bacterium]